jgi:predicted ester cyclase
MHCAMLGSGPAWADESVRNRLVQHGRRIGQLHASGEHVVTQYTATGTHNGDLMGIPPTRRQAEVHGCTVAEIRNGKVVRSYVYWDIKRVEVP